MNNRPLTVTLIGWLFIVTGFFGIAYHATEMHIDNPFESDLLLALTVRLLAIGGGIFLLRGAAWACWLLLLWLSYHVVVSLRHSVTGFLFHCVLLVVVVVVLLRPPASRYFQKETPSAE
jgi:hypothetical protein